MLTVEHLTFSYSRRSAPVLRDAALTLRDGEIGILLGRNGSGKTTLFRNLLGICTPDSGSIRFDGQELTALPRRQRARCIAYVPQDIRFGDLTVFDSVLLGRLSRFGLQAGPADRAAAAQVLADMALSPLAERRVTELSGGERQKVAIAGRWCRSLVCCCWTSPPAVWTCPTSICCCGRQKKRLRSGISPS